MKDLYLLIKPRFLEFKNQLVRSDGRWKKKTVLFGGLGLAFLVGTFLISCRVLLHFKSAEIIGDLLAQHFLSMILLVFFSLLVFSHVVTALSNLYISRDLELCHSTPARIEEIFVSRSGYTLIDSSWMFIVFGLPVFMAYAYVYRPSPNFYFLLFHMSIAMVIIAGGTGILITMLLVKIFPAQRTRDLMMLLSLLLVVGLYFMFRFLRPEKLVDPDAFFTITQYMSALGAPKSPFLPTHWISETLWHSLSGSNKNGHFFEIMLTWNTAIAVIVIDIWVAEAIYFAGFSKSQEAKRRRLGSTTLLNLFTRCIPKAIGEDLKAVLSKDIRTFFRDNTQWSQLLLIAALVVVYVYNFSVLPLDKSPIRMDFLQNELAFLNMGLAGFVLSAVSARFVFAAVSAEGEAYWIIRSSPLTLRSYLWGKYFFFILPMAIVGELLIIVTNLFLDVTPLMMVISSVTMFLMVFGIVGLGIGFGAIYPNFRHQNIAQVSTGFGGVFYMIICAIFIGIVIMLEAGPVYILFVSGFRGIPPSFVQWAFIIASFLFVIIVIFFATFRPMKMGLKSLLQYEP